MSSSLQRTLAGARCHRSHFWLKVQIRPWLCCRPLFGKLLLLFVVFFLAAHWGYLLLELDVTVAILALLLFVVFFLVQGTDQALALLLLELDVTVPISAQGTDQALALLPASFRQIAAAFCCLLPCSTLGLPLAGARCHRGSLAQGTDQALALLPASFRQIAAACCCLLPCSALGLPLAGARCHRSHFLLKVQIRPWLCCRPLVGKLLLLFVVFFLAAHWGYLLLELDVTVAILAQGTDQALALLPASFRQIAAAFCCLLPCRLLLLFVVFFLAAHWGYLLLELDVTVGILAQGTDQALPLFGKLLLLFVVFFLAP